MKKLQTVKSIDDIKVGTVLIPANSRVRFIDGILTCSQHLISIVNDDQRNSYGRFLTETKHDGVFDRRYLNYSELVGLRIAESK